MCRWTVRMVWIAGFFFGEDWAALNQMRDGVSCIPSIAEEESFVYETCIYRFQSPPQT